jgi:hypothetical protein
MARPQVANGEKGLQIWRVAANILNKQSRTADREWYSSLGLGVWLTTHRKKVMCYEMFQSASDLDCSFGDLREIGIDGANWIWLAQDKVQWWAFVSTVMKLLVP